MRTLINDLSEKNKIEIMAILFFVSIFIYIIFTSLLFSKLHSSIAFGIRVLLFSTIIAVSDILVDQVLIDFGLDDSLPVIFGIAVIGFILFVWIARYKHFFIKSLSPLYSKSLTSFVPSDFLQYTRFQKSSKFNFNTPNIFEFLH